MNLRQQINRFRLSVLAAIWLVPLSAQAQWLHTENLFDQEHIHAYVVAGILIAIFVLMFYNRLNVYRNHDEQRELRNRTARLGLIMQTARLRLWVYDHTTSHYQFLNEEGEYSQEYNPIDFAMFYNRDDFELLRSAIFDLCENKRIQSTVKVSSNEANDKTIHHYEIHLSIASKDENGRVNRLLGVQHDVTDEYTKRESADEFMMRYDIIFNSALIDMFYYDKKGILTDINETACRSFHVKDRQKLLDSKFQYQQNPFFNEIDFTDARNIETSSIIDFSHHQEESYHSKSLGNKMMYYEASINSIYDKKGNLEGVYIAGRDITEMVESFHQQQAGAIALKKATQHIKEYVDNINYALRISNVRLVNYYPQSYTLDISNIIGKSQIRLSQLRCIRLAMPRYRRAVSSILNRMDHLTSYPINQTIETEIRDEKKRQIALMFNLIPMLDEQGGVERYFGMCRNMTDIVETERQLAIETQKAQEAELLKESFLTNMSYEIRTPLTAVLGFADLFQQEHDEEDEPVFVEEIKKNTNTLLLLINDILFLSRLDADMVEFKHDDFDFAEYFDAYCQMGWSSISPEVKTSIENPYEHLVVNGDIEQLGKAIQMLCSIASSHTHKGSVRAKLEYRRGEVAITIEDTGIGIDAETLPHVFERFVRDKREELCGTGLDLPIIETIVKKMGGSIEIQSELEKGTTVWIFLPLEAKTIEKKRELNI